MYFIKKLYLALLVILVLALGFIYYNYNPAKYSFFPKCPFFTLTGLNCPGCGSQRAINCLLHGQIFKAARYNLLLVLSLPFLAVHFGYKTASVFYKQDLRWKIIYNPFIPWVIFSFVIIFWILRNIPFYPFNYLSAGQ